MGSPVTIPSMTSFSVSFLVPRHSVKFHQSQSTSKTAKFKAVNCQSFRSQECAMLFASLYIGHRNKPLWKFAPLPRCSWVLSIRSHPFLRESRIMDLLAPTISVSTRSSPFLPSRPRQWDDWTGLRESIRLHYVGQLEGANRQGVPPTIRVGANSTDRTTFSFYRCNHSCASRRGVRNGSLTTHLSTQKSNFSQSRRHSRLCRILGSQKKSS